MQSLLLSADALLYCLHANCLKAIFQFSGGTASITRPVTDTMEDRGALKAMADHLRAGRLRTLTLDPGESRLCTRLYLAGWPFDLASVAAIASHRQGTLLCARTEFEELEVDFALQRVSCAEILLQMVAAKVISLHEADRYLLRMREMGLDSPIATIDPPTLQQWQRRELRL